MIDGAGGIGFSELIKACAAGARVCIYGGTSGAMTGVTPQIIFYKQICIYGSTMGTGEEFLEMIRFIEKHTLIPIIDTTFDLQNGNNALQKMDSGQQFGKIVLSIN